MNLKIVDRWDSARIIYQAEAESFRALVEAAVKSGANLSSANLSSANLSSADLSRANLSSADLSRADLSSADLSRADLSGANLYGANLSSADLSSANLSRANLYGANLSSANLSRANLYGANLYGAKNNDLAIAQTYVAPDSGPFFAWKKCRNNVIVRLFIPSKARRSNSTGRKCRAERAKVLEVIGAEVGESIHNSTFTYKVGQWVHCDKWEENRWVECGGGIHFFITRVEAEAYQ